MTVQVRLAGPDDLTAVYALRHEVFVVGQDVPPELERDDLDEDADHAIAVSAGDVVGTGRLVVGRIDELGRLEPGTQQVATVGRMAVAASQRRTGTGAKLLARLEELARERGLATVELHAQVQARRFYERAGYQQFGEVYLEAGIEHVGMRKRL